MSALRRLATDLVLDRLDRRTRGMVCTAGAGVALLAGRKLSFFGLLGQGLRDIEAEWRADHPDFEGGWRERWRWSIEHYEATHQDPTNRKLHIVGVPIIVGGVTGLLIWPAYSPPWALSAGAFGFGWALNLIGHAVYERNAPAFVEDPLGFVAGPVWDLMHLKRWLAASDGPEPPIVVAA